MRISQVFRNASLDYAYLKPEGGAFHWTSQAPRTAFLSIHFLGRNKKLSTNASY